MNNYGRIIVIEGSDGSGKTTQTNLLIERFRKEGVSVETLRFPQYTENLFGALIRECLDGKHGDFINMDPKIASVLYACDRFETMKKIEDWQEEGKVIVLDRYITSNQIHQGGKIKDENKRAEFLTWLSKMEYDILKIKKPDSVFYLNVPMEISVDLISKREGVKDSADSDFEYLKNSKEAGLYMVKTESFWKTIDCMEEGKLLSPEAIAERIWKSLGEA
ncbi:MAG: dTMP kinase [Patescibacteria group bacterium]|nr:dTMP kinase [Patescibacteria group bacterium]